LLAQQRGQRAVLWMENSFRGQQVASPGQGSFLPTFIIMMKEEFNITGTRLPHLHCMMDNRAKLAGVMEMIETGKKLAIRAGSTRLEKERCGLEVKIIFLRAWVYSFVFGN
jgi:hypothetical protein